MIFLVETGSGVSGATSYISLEDADSHFEALENTNWTNASLGQKQQALIRASLYVDSYQFEGCPRRADQGLSWPRSGAKDTEGRPLRGIPFALRAAVLELAGDYIKSPPQSFDKGQILKEKVGPVELVYSATEKQPGFVYRLLSQIGARTRANRVLRG
ncbi:MAG: hypothetical protein MI743_11715 [Sneathiellales bacterium]|nr:hypothetical protein [Sneathiellales bacterium]